MDPVDRQLHLVLIGFGHVGRRFVRLLQELDPRLRSTLGLTTRVIGIATRTRGCAFDATGLDAVGLAERLEAGGALTDEDADTTHAIVDAESLIARAALQSQASLIMVETTTLDVTRGEPATRHVRHALACGMHVVTANKGPVAHACHALQALAARAGRRFLFEGAVMDGTPVFNLVRRTLPMVKVIGFRGVVNSTTNAMLTAMERGVPPERALARLQEEGIAEADPTLDVDGWDAAAKTAVLVNALTQARVTPQDIARTGIGAITMDDVARARDAGRRIKLVASARFEDSRVVGRVTPEWLGPDDPLAALEGTASGLVVETDLLGSLGILQLDANLTHTAYALVSDLLAIAGDAEVGEPSRRDSPAHAVE